MVATVTARLSTALGTGDLRALYADRYETEPMVQLREDVPGTADVRGSNRARVHVVVDGERGVATAICVIDNLVKGAAGQAVQCLNLALGLPETRGLPLVPLLP